MQQKQMGSSFFYPPKSLLRLPMTQFNQTLILSFRHIAIAILLAIKSEFLSTKDQNALQYYYLITFPSIRILINY